MNLTEELKETIACFLCREEIKDQEILAKLNSVVQELEEFSLSSLSRGRVKVTVCNILPSVILVMVDDKENLTAQCVRLQKMVEDVIQSRLQSLKC